MVNFIYPNYKQRAIGLGDSVSANLLAGAVTVSLIDTGTYTYDNAHWYISNVGGASIIANSSALGSKTTVNGVFDAANVVFSSVTGTTAEAVIIWIDTGTETTSPLVAYLDTNITGLPVTPNGGDINLNWATGGIFAI